MKAVLISIQPKWCELIARFKKLVEVRKTKPKLDVPFKCYIYCTKDKHGWFDFLKKERLDGKVIGEFVCDYINEWDIDPQTKKYFMTSEELNETCLSYDQLHKYGKDEILHGWHISNLVIYAKPKELSTFLKVCDKELSDNCLSCKHIDYTDLGKEVCDRRIVRPPQSWCYVESLAG